MNKVKLNDITIAYEDAGAGENILVLVHGHPFDRTMWRPQINAVKEAGWRVIVPDLRGYGETSVVSGKTTLNLFAHDIAALLDHLGAGPVVTGVSRWVTNPSWSSAGSMRTECEGSCSLRLFLRPRRMKGSEIAT
jgi:hypothetical protein